MTRRGFTLLEILLAVSIFAMIGAGVLAFLSAGRRLDERIRSHSEARQTGRAVLRILERDFRAAFASGGKFGTGIIGTDGLGEDASDEIELVTASHRPIEPEDGTESNEIDISRTIYRIDSELGLVRLKITHLTEEQRVVNEDELREEISELVTGLQIRYHDGAGWVDSWDTSTSETMPKALEIELEVAPTGEGDPLTIRTALWLPVGATYEAPEEE